MAEHQGTNSVGIAEGEETTTHNKQYYCVGTPAPLMHRANGLEDVPGPLRRTTGASRELMGKDVKKNFRVRFRINVPKVGAEHRLLQRLGVGEIAVMGQGNAIGRVHVHRLGFGHARRAGGGIAYVANAMMPLQALHVLLLEYVPHKTIGLAHG